MSGCGSCSGIGGRPGGRGGARRHGGTMSMFGSGCSIATSTGNAQYSCLPAELYWLSPSHKDTLPLKFLEFRNLRAVVHLSQCSWISGPACPSLRYIARATMGVVRAIRRKSVQASSAWLGGEYRWIIVVVSPSDQDGVWSTP